MRNLILLCLAGAAGYYIYTNYLATGGRNVPEVQWQKNAAVMKKCIKREMDMAGLGGLGGVSMDAGDAEALCAEENNFYLDNGHWKSY